MLLRESRQPIVIRMGQPMHSFDGPKEGARDKDSSRSPWFGENYHYFWHLDSALSNSAVMNLMAPDRYSLVLVRVSLSRASCEHPILLIKLQISRGIFSIELLAGAQ
jgi:hypothetical protein